MAGREHFDEHHTRRYDAKEDARAAEKVALLEEPGVVSAGSSVVDLGAGADRSRWPTCVEAEYTDSVLARYVCREQ